MEKQIIYLDGFGTEPIHCELFKPIEFTVYKTHIESYGRDKNEKFAVFDIYSKILNTHIALPDFTKEMLDYAKKNANNTKAKILIGYVIAYLPQNVYRLYNYSDVLNGKCRMNQVYDLYEPNPLVNDIFGYLRYAYDPEEGKTDCLEDLQKTINSYFNHFYNIECKSRRNEFFPPIL